MNNYTPCKQAYNIIETNNLNHKYRNFINNDKNEDNNMLTI